MMDRRSLLWCAGCLLLSSRLPASSQDRATSGVIDPDKEFPPVEARYYKKLKDGRVECDLCPNRCRVADLERGSCGVRENRKGTYYTLVHSRICSVHVDPVEKKPLFHFLPGTDALSVATPGCNMFCKFCQNWQISQFRPEQIDCIRVTPKRLHEVAGRHRAPTIAYTYTEPVVFAEYVYDTAALGEKTGVRSVIISNGYIEQKPLKDLLSVLDGVKIDLKAFSNRFYEEITGGKLSSILESLVTIRESGKWLEIVVLIIPTLNDGPSEIRKMARWIRANLGTDVPIHFSRFHPTYRMKNLPSTPVKTLERCHDIAVEAGLRYVYLGNVPGHAFEHTFCHNCGKTLIRRYGFRILENHLDRGKCPFCNTTIPGTWT